MDKTLQRTIGECLNAAASGRFFEDWEFPTLFGLERSEVAKIAAAWPNVDEADELVHTAINNSFLHLLGYPTLDNVTELPQYISVSEVELEVLFNQWRNRDNGNPPSNNERSNNDFISEPN